MMEILKGKIKEKRRYSISMDKKQSDFAKKILNFAEIALGKTA